jgi:subtilase family serine protease
MAKGLATLNNFHTRPHSSIASAAVRALVPADLATIYNLSPLYNAGLNGNNQSIAIIGRSNINPADIAAFRSAHGLPDNPVTTVIAAGADPGFSNTGDALEATLDTEWAGAIAPQAVIKLVIAASTASTDGIDLAAQYAISHNVAPIVSVSFGTCEAEANNAFYSALWQQAAVEGISVIVSAGDSGAAGCDLPSAAIGTVKSVNALCSTPYNTCVGGTQFADTQNSGAFWHPGSNALLGSATGYIPEQAWNESALNGGTGLLAGAGGISAIYPNRQIPDISLAAARHDGYSIWFNGAPLTVSGTSAAAPAFAAILALIIQKNGQKTGSPQGNINPALYALAAQPGNFHDVTSGNNSVPGLAGYSAATGYDLATGLGSVNAAQLADNWTSVGPPSCTLTAGSASLTVVQNQSASTTLACGSVQGTFKSSLALAVSGAPAGVTASFSPESTLTPNSDVKSLKITADASTKPGTYNLVVSAASSPFATSLVVPLTVNTPDTFVITPSATTFSMPQGTSATLTLTSARSGTFNSAITFQTSGLPSAVNTTLSATTIAAPGNGVITITLAPLSIANPAPVGTYTLLVQATGGGLVLRIPITVKVTAAPAFTFTASSAVVTLRNPYVPSGGTPVPTTATLTLTTGSLTNSFNQPVALSVGTLPTGVTSAFSSATIAAPGAGTSTLTLSIANAAATGVSTFTVTATGGTASTGIITRYINVELIVTTPSTFTISVPYTSYTLMAGSSFSQTLTAAPVFGYNSNITLTKTAPAGVNVSLSAAAISGNYGTAQLTIQPLITTAAGSYTITVTGTDPITTNAQTLTITLTVGTVTTTLASNTITAPRGTAVSTTITTAATSYTGNVVLSLSGLPAGVSYTFSPTSIVGGSGTSAMTLLANTATAPGSYLVTLRSSAAGIIFTTTFTLTIT